MGTRFSARPDRPWGPPSLLYNGYRVFPGGKVRPGRAADHSPPSSAAVIGRAEVYLYPPSGPHQACNGITLPFLPQFEMEAIVQHCVPVSLHLENELKVPTEYTSDDPLRGVGSNISTAPDRYRTSSHQSTT